MALIDMSETYQMTNDGDHIDGTDVYQSNRNLLDNPWFTVNQRQLPNGSTVSANSYGVDRWFGVGAGYKLDADGIILAGTMVQRWDDKAWLSGKTVTYSALYADGTLAYGTGTFAQSSRITLNDGGTVLIVNTGQGNFSVGEPTKVLRAVKLELGSVSTLANDAPPDYGTELAKCQRYYYRITGVTFLDLGAALAESATAWLLRFPLPVPMRVAPTTAVSGNFVLWNGSAGNACSGISTHTAVTPPTNPAYVAIKGTSTGMTTGNRYNIQARNQANAYIEFSADL